MMSSGYEPSEVVVTGATHGSTERAARWLAGSMLSFNLAGEAKQLLEEEVWQHTGRNAKTLIKEADLRVVLVALRRGMSMDAHQTAGPVLIQAISGRLRVNLPDQHINLAPSQCVALEAKVQHSVTAGEDSIFLLTIAWPGHSAISQP